MYDAEPIVDEATIDETKIDETKTEDPQMGDPAAVEEMVADPPLEDEAPSDEAPPDEASSDEVPSDESALRRRRRAEAQEITENWFCGPHLLGLRETRSRPISSAASIRWSMQDKIFRVLDSDGRRESEFKDGKRKITPKKVFPGYVLVENDHGPDQSWYVDA